MDIEILKQFLRPIQHITLNLIQETAIRRKNCEHLKIPTAAIIKCNTLTMQLNNAKSYCLDMTPQQTSPLGYALKFS
ncbi:hypothetical protein AMELA_G00100280 [Ameiurus melas]|uniref:Uncharacterized protein n=1 Tax=Ameiurus melas TaxID=219545 RepID=A0A7J6ATD5_AMEME|nr:hypothetical protein AMELA_G00100280 [Ameiurus melas]